MNAKNLPLKFALVALVVAVCLWSIFLGNGLKQGIDLRGGHSLTFEVRTQTSELNRIDEQLAALRARLGEAETEERKAEIAQQIADLEVERDRLREFGRDEGDLVEEVIARLKERIDPRGLYNTEWRPVGGNRFEVRMPAAREGSREAKLEYLRAIEAVENDNIRRSEIRRVLQLAGEQRSERIAELARGQAELANLLTDLAETYDRMVAARRAGNEEARLNALADYEAGVRAVLATNVDLPTLQNTLERYVPPRMVNDVGEAEARRRNAEYRERVEEIVATHPGRGDQIKRLVSAHEDWAQQRQYLDDPADLKRLIAKAGVLEFRIVPTTGQGENTLGRQEIDRYVRQIQDKGPEFGRRQAQPYLWFPLGEDRASYPGTITTDYAGQRYVLLHNRDAWTMLSDGPGGWELDSAFPDRDRMNQPAVGFTMNATGARLFGSLTSQHIGQPMAVLLDDAVYSIANIESAISSRGIITGSFTPTEVQDLVRTLRAGSLPARVNPDPVREETFGPSLGAVNRERGVRAAYAGLIAVAAFMLIYYLMAGAIADVALLLNIILILGGMSLLSAVFTLPGIAGIILTIGIAVDANVLIFERLREEQEKGQSVRMALKNAYQRAFSAIFDANLTTLITCLILGWVGTEEIRGFAITLGLGVAFSLFTALVVTRWVFQALLDGRVVTRPIRMLRILGVPKVNWMAKRYVFWAISGGLVVLGVLSLVGQGKDIWGIEFSSGTQVVIRLEEDAMLDGELPDDAVVRRLVTEEAAAMGYRRLHDTARVETLTDPDRVSNFLSRYAGGDNAVSRDEAPELDEDFFKAVDADGNGVLSYEEIRENLPEGSYQLSTTENDLGRIREVIREAFGDAREVRVRLDHELVTSGVAPGIDVPVAADGLTRIDESLREQAAANYRGELQDYDGGVMMVFRDIEPAQTRGELLQRIREMRLQPDFASQLLHRTEVLGIEPGPEDTWTAAAVVVAPSDPDALDREGAWDEFARREEELVAAALEREEAIVATNFDPAIAGQAAQLAIVALVLSWAAIVAYLWFRFGNWRWGLAAVVCLIHDTVIVVGLVAATGWAYKYLGWLGIDSFKIDIAMVAALLTVIGYSVNDTIVVFDRIRENRGKLTTVSPLVINTSVNQTLSRTLLTSGTTLIVLLVMYIWGGPGIHGFSFALLVGVLFGTYSSVAVASPLLMGFRRALVAKTAGAVADEQ